MTAPMPIIFVGHGAPLLAVDAEKGEPLSRWGEKLPRPKAILAISAHWERSPPTLGSLEHTQLLYDFSGFPPELYQVQYPAPGAAGLVQRVRDLLQGDYGAIAQLPDRRLDHGVWVPLRWLYPAADIPVIQLSMPRKATMDELLAFGAALAPLAQEGVLLMASGVLTHNLGRIDMRPAAPIPTWAQEFDDWCAQALQDWNVEAILRYRQLAPHAVVAHPTEEHFAPLVVALGAAREIAKRVSFPITGFEFGSISRRCVEFSAT